MPKHKLSNACRVAIWKAHNKKCIYCQKIIRYYELNIDHIIPQNLNNNPTKFYQLKRDYDLPSDFSIHDYSNLVPCHHSCNKRKGGSLFSKPTILYYMEIAKTKKDKAKIIKNQIEQEDKKDEILSKLDILLEKRSITSEEVLQILNAYEVISEEFFNEPIVITFGLTFENAVKSGFLPDKISNFYPHLCDWLEKDLEKTLNSCVTCPFSKTEASYRDGECLSVRLAFFDLKIDEIKKFSSPWWEILEIKTFSEIYKNIGLKEWFEHLSTKNLNES